MKKLSLILSILILIFITTSYAQNAKEVDNNFLRFIKNKDWSQARNLFSYSVKSKITENGLSKIFESVSAQAGNFESFSEINNVTPYKNNGFFLAHYEKAMLIMQFHSNDSAKISGFFFVPPDKLYKSAPYSDESKYKTTTLTVTSGNISLPGILTVPTNEVATKFPIVVMVGGSGPSDMDETIGTEKPFKDLSIGLAVNGVASVRYDKRTFIYHNLSQNMSIESEYLDDIVSAIQIAKTTQGVDTNKIFILGHSLGGMIAPMVLKNNPSLCGAILLEANARPLEDLIYDQALHLEKVKFNEPSDHTELINTIQAIKKITLVDTSKSYMNIKGSYWLSLNAYNPVKVAVSLQNQQMLIIQGGNDYQVTNTDFEIWSKYLNKKRNVAFKFYPLINHAIIEGKGLFSPYEYYEPMNSPMYIAKDISMWIKSIND